MDADTEPKTEAQIRKAAKDEIIAYLKEKKQKGDPITDCEKGKIDSYLKEKGYTTIERTMGFSDVKKCKDEVVISKRDLFTEYYRYIGRTG